MDEAGPGPGSVLDQLRGNGRRNLQIRSLLCERGLLARADGSAKWTQDKTSVLVGVYGPRQTVTRNEDAEKAMVMVVYKPKSGQAGNRERLFEQLLKQTVEGTILASLHPRTLVSITVQEISDDGGMLSCALNAVDAALTDAGIPLRHIFAAATCCLRRDGQLLVDPDLQEEKDAQAIVTNCFAAKLKKPDDKQAAVAQGLLASQTAGSMSVDDFLRLKDLSHNFCEKIASFSRLSLAKTFA